MVASVHQPSIEMFEQFSAVLLLCRGRLLWQGGASEAGASFSASGIPCPPGRAISDHLLAVASQPEAPQQVVTISQRPPLPAADAASKNGEHGVYGTAPQEDSRQPGRRLSLEENAGVSGGQKDVVTVTLLPEAGAAADREGLQAEGERPGFMRQCCVLAWREMLALWRSPALFVAHLGLALVIALWLGTVYYKLGLFFTGFQDRLGAIFVSLLFFALSSLSAAELFVADRPQLRKEAHRYYSPMSYFAVKAGVDLMIIRVIPAFVFSAVIYWRGPCRCAPANAWLHRRSWVQQLSTRTKNTG